LMLGKPEDYQVGEVSTRLQKEQRVWMIRNDEGMYALIAICTHLGCTPIWWPTEDRFKCPCHGSNFLIDGQNVAGPAPEWIAPVLLYWGGGAPESSPRTKSRSWSTSKGLSRLA
jgi:Rieske Fe-S protein